MLEVGSERILVDPMLSPPGAFLPFAVLRHPPRRNPLVALPDGAHELALTATAALITHCRRGHLDHLDGPGIALLAERRIPVFCSRADADHLRRRGANIVPLELAVDQTMLGGSVRPVPATHGHGWIGRAMGAGVGYVLRFPGEPSLYLSGDTVLTKDVEAVLGELGPDVSVVHAGGATLDVGAPILMSIQEVVRFVDLAPGVVVATHMEALNHCPTTRAMLREALEGAGLIHKARIPADGEALTFQAA